MLRVPYTEPIQWPRSLDAYVKRASVERAARLEDDLRRAVILQEYAYLERLHIVYTETVDRPVPPAVASWIG